MVMDFPRRFINEAKAAHVGWGIKRKRKETRRKMKFKEMDCQKTETGEPELEGA